MPFQLWGVHCEPVDVQRGGGVGVGLAEELEDRDRCPWDRGWRRPSHAGKRKALQRHLLAGQFRAVLPATIVGEMKL
jgi:hypothetical protein